MLDALSEHYHTDPYTLIQEWDLGRLDFNLNVMIRANDEREFQRKKGG